MNHRAVTGPAGRKNISGATAAGPLYFFVLALLLAVLYSNTFFSPFTFDDAQIIENYYIQTSEFNIDTFKRITQLSPNKRRLLSNLSFALNYYFAGYDVLGFHLVNLIIHTVAAFIFFLLARTTLGLCGAPLLRQKAPEIAFAAALLWAVHPLQTNSVTYIVQRMNAMAALFCLLSLFSYVRARLAASGVARAWFFGAAALFGAMALFSKENSAMLPVLIGGYEAFFLQRPHQAKRYANRNLAFYALALFGFVAICLLFLGRSPIEAILASFSSREFTLGQRLLTETRVIFHYLSLLILPLPSRLNLAYDFPLSTGLLAPPQTLLAALGIGGLALLVLLLFRRDRLAAFAIFWLLANLAIESSVIALEIIFEHRMYLPAMFPVLAAVAWLFRLTPKKQATARALLAVAALTLALFTWQRNSVWKSEISLWTDVLNKAPNLARAYVNLGKAYGEAGQHQRAETLLRKAISLAPSDGRAYLSLGVALENQKQLSAAVALYNQALSMPKGVDRAKLHANMSGAHLKLGNFGQAQYHGRESLAVNPYRVQPYLILSGAYFKSGDPINAENTLQRALILFPDNGNLYVQLGSIYENQNRLAEAASALNKALTKKDVDLVQAYNNLGIVYWRQRLLAQSKNAAEKALELDPNFLDAYITHGITLEEMGQQELAFAQFRKGWQLGLDMVGVYNNWAVNFMERNDVDRALSYLQEAVKLEPRRIESYDNLGRALMMKKMYKEAEKVRNTAQNLRNAATQRQF